MFVENTCYIHGYHLSVIINGLKLTSHHRHFWTLQITFLQALHFRTAERITADFHLHWISIRRSRSPRKYAKATRHIILRRTLRFTASGRSPHDRAPNGLVGTSFFRIDAHGQKPIKRRPCSLFIPDSFCCFARRSWKRPTRLFVENCTIIPY